MIQKDSPYYEVVDGKKDRRDYEKTHSVVKKHHISQIDKEGKMIMGNCDFCSDRSLRNAHVLSFVCLSVQLKVL